MFAVSVVNRRAVLPEV